MLAHQQIWSAIDKLAEHHNLSPSGLARRAGLDPTIFNKSKRFAKDGRARWPSTESIAKILNVTGADFGTFHGFVRGEPSQAEDLIDGQIIKANATRLDGSLSNNGQRFDQYCEQVDIPVIINPGDFALRILGGALLPIYRHGDIVIVSGSQSAKLGERIVVKTNEEQLIAGLLLAQDGQFMTLMPFNPEHQMQKFLVKNLEWVRPITWVSQ